MAGLDRELRGQQEVKSGQATGLREGKEPLGEQGGLNPQGEVPGIKKGHPAAVKRSRFALAVARAYHTIAYTFHMRRFHELLGLGSGLPASGSPIWLLGVGYQGSKESTALEQDVVEAFLLDFTSRLWFTYRKDFPAVKETNLSSDAGWGCMIRSGQMILAQALLVHFLGRTWRWYQNEKQQEEYYKLLHYFEDSPAADCPLSLHNIVEAGSKHGVVAGCWLGPYALSRTFEAMARQEPSQASFPFVIYVASGDAEGERGGAPVLYMDEVAKLCREREGSEEQSTSGHEEDDVLTKQAQNWCPVLVLVPLVLGVDKVNPRYLPSLRATFSFPQSVGIIGGKPGSSLYFVGCQDDQVFYLDPHEVQPTVPVLQQAAEDTTSSYHCSTVRRLSIETIDPTLALGFYCRDHGEFVDLCSRITALAAESGGAPMFTIGTDKRTQQQALLVPFETDEMMEKAEGEGEKDEWQLL